MISAVVSRNAGQGGKLSFRLFAEAYFLLAWVIAPVLIFMLIDIVWFPLFIIRYFGFIHIL